MNARMCRLALFLFLLLPATAMPVVAQPATPGTRSTPAAQSPAANKGAEDEDEAYRHSATVQKLGSMMGIGTDKAATLFEVINFAVLAGLVGAFLLKALPKTFRARNSTIQKHLVDARAATEEATVRMNTIEDRLSRLDGEIDAMRAQAEKDTAAEEERFRAALEAERQHILLAAEQQIAAATHAAERQLQRQAAELAVEQAARKLTVSAETDRLLVQQFARRLGESAQGGDN